MAELVDAYVSGAYVARRAGSSPVLGTEFFENIAAAGLLSPEKNVLRCFSESAGGEIGIHATLRG